MKQFMSHIVITIKLMNHVQFTNSSMIDLKSSCDEFVQRVKTMS